MFKNKWNVLYIILAGLVIFSIFAVPNIAIGSMNASKEKIITVDMK